MKNSIENIHFRYNILIPKKGYASIIVSLEQWIKKNELEEYLTFGDIEYTAREVKLDTPDIKLIQKAKDQTCFRY